MWISESQPLRDDVVKILVKEDGVDLSFSDVIDLWCGDNDAFRRFFVHLFKGTPFGCFRFETPPVTASSKDQVFQFVLVDSPEIDLIPDARDFEEYFERRPDDVLVFDNLGGDATMVVPRPREGTPGYAHIAAFVRHAPVDQQLRLWKTVGQAMHRLICETPVWLNTAGGGVPWLHVRIDSSPKYYVFDEYKFPPKR